MSAMCMCGRELGRMGRKEASNKEGERKWKGRKRATREGERKWKGNSDIKKERSKAKNNNRGIRKSKTTHQVPSTHTGIFTCCMLRLLGFA